MPRLRPFALVLAAVAVAAALSGCTATVSMQPAENANDPLCADVVARLPETVASQDRRWTDAQATGAWGSPTAVLLTCGVTPPGPTTMRCATIDGVDWIIDETDAPRYRVTTYGRTPAVQVFFEDVSSREVLDTLSPLVSSLPVNAACVEREDATLVP